MGKQRKSPDDEHKLYGAFVSVLFVGVFIIGSWLAIFALFMNR
ncbi:cytochrome c oxidase subunit 2A [Gracilibacillus marinus]|uniref:Cytochrome c oxidase subunit 2A n=1 Tax=Gracilibacillus marinus TaxID=630535 RepID=A0ABV8VUB9_9BACI